MLPSVDEQRLVLMLQMPMHFHSLVVENTTRCTARCDMCYQSAGPHGSEAMGLASLELAPLLEVLRAAARIETLDKRFHLSGGEAFLDVGFCLSLFRAARAAGFTEVTATTNAYWATTSATAKSICRRLANAGLTSLEISWDFWHMRWVSPDAVSNCVDACAAVGVSTTLRVLSSKSHRLDAALSFIRAESLDRVTHVFCVPAFPTGRAATSIPIEEFIDSSSGLDDSCHGALNLAINPVGDVFPCCAGLDQTSLVAFGNIHNDSIVDIAESLNRSPILRSVVFGGVKSLLPALAEAGLDTRGYLDSRCICHLCWRIFSSRQCVEAIREYLPDEQTWALRLASSYLRSKRIRRTEQ